MTFLGALQLFLLAVIAFVALSGVLVSALVPFVLRWTEAWAPASRHRALALLAAAPLVLSAASLVSVLLPSLLGFVWPVLDHCRVHGGHSHLCFVHPSRDAGGWAGWTLIAVASAWLLVRIWRGARRLAHAARLVRSLEDAASHDAALGLWIVPTASPLCLSAGLLRPRFLISSGLLRALSESELHVVVAHEHAHEQRKDSLVRAAVRVATSLSPSAARTKLLAAIELAAERACDEAAAEQTGDRLAVAETLLAIERRFTGAAPQATNAFAAGFGSSSLPMRVAGMLAPAPRASALRILVTALSLAVLLVLGSFELLHHATETVLAILNH